MEFINSLYYICTTKRNKMKSFTNILGTEIEYKPFYNNAEGVWYSARYEDGKLDMVLELREFDNKFECAQDCFKRIQNFLV